jgi:hypothetical protein
MAYLMDRINQQLSKTGYEARSKQARTWLRSKIPDLNPTARKIMTGGNERKTITSIIGHMYFFYYDPKTKDTLPYYDRFPLVIPIQLYKDGFLGLNLHYIHPKHRIILLDKLSSFASNHVYDQSTKLRLNYQVLSSFSQAYEATPCLKRYLSNHVESRFVEIHANEWDIAALLPVEQFQKASTSKVWADSRKKF